MSVFGTTQFTSKNNTTQNPCLGNSVNTAAGDLIIVGWSGANAPSGVPTDTVGNTYVLDATNGFIIDGFGTRQYMWYCLGSIGANATNVISVPFSGGVSGTVQVWDVPLTGGTALFDRCAKGSSNGAVNPATASFNTAGTDEYVAIGCCSATLASNYTVGSGYTLDAATTSVGSISRYGAEHQIYTSTQTGITPGFSAASGDWTIVAVAIKANPLFSISGSASAGAKIWYVGAASGSVTADGSGNWSVTNLSNGAYTLWATAANKSFSPLTSAQTVSGSNITGVTFTPTTSIFGNPVVVNNTASTSTTVTATTNTALRDLIVLTTCSDRATAPTGIADTVGNSYTQAGTVTQLPTGTSYITVWYCAASIGANASNVITVTYSGSTTGSLSVSNVPVTAGFNAVFDVTAVGSNFSGTAMATASFNTAGTDEIVLASGSCNSSAPTYTVQNGYLVDNSGSGQTFTKIGAESVRFGATQTGITSSMTASAGGSWAMRVVAFKAAQVAWTISGNAGTCSATVSYTGTASGSVSADSSGDYSIPLLAAGTYTITPSKASYTFSPANQSKTITSADITGVNFFQVLDQATGITLTEIYFNSFTGADENPVDPTNLDPEAFTALKVLNHVGLATINTNFGEAFYIGTPALNDDQYASITVHAWVAASDNELFITLRDDGTSENCYAASIFDNNDGTATVEVDAFVGNTSVQTLYSDDAASLPAACDSFTLAVVGTSVALYKNNTQLSVATSTHRSTGGASISLATPSPNVITNLTVTNIIFGNASGLLPPPVPPVISATEFGYNNDFMF